MNQDALTKIIEVAVEAVNLTLPDDSKLELSDETKLLGDGSVLDSLGSVTFLVELDQEFERVFGKSPDLLSVLSDDPEAISTFLNLQQYLSTKF